MGWVTSKLSCWRWRWCVWSTGILGWARGSVYFMMETNSSLCRLCGMPFMPFVVGVKTSRRKSWTILVSSWTRVKVAFRILWILGTWQLLLGRQKPEVLIFCLATFVVIPLVNVDFQMLFFFSWTTKCPPPTPPCAMNTIHGERIPPWMLRATFEAIFGPAPWSVWRFSCKEIQKIP